MKSLLKDTTKVVIFLCFFFIILIIKFTIGYMTLTWYSDIGARMNNMYDKSYRLCEKMKSLIKSEPGFNNNNQ